MSPTRVYLFLCLVLPVGLVGCGGEEPLVPVQGRVTLKGQPIKGGTLIFSPLPAHNGDYIAGKPASANIKPDGSYTLETYRPGDGARIGKHRVLFTPPPQELTDQQRTDRKYKAPPPLYMGLSASPAEVEVKRGPNTIDLELAPARK